MNAGKKAGKGHGAGVVDTTLELLWRMMPATMLENATIRQMSDAARDFGDTLQKGGVGLFFYAGHGMQIKGRNYLTPIGADIQREDEVSFNALTNRMSRNWNWSANATRRPAALCTSAACPYQ